MMLRSIGLPELLVILCVLLAPVMIVAIILFVIRNSASRNPAPPSTNPGNAFCTQCGGAPLRRDLLRKMRDAARVR